MSELIRPVNFYMAFERVFCTEIDVVFGTLYVYLLFFHLIWCH